VSTFKIKSISLHWRAKERRKNDAMRRSRAYFYIFSENIKYSFCKAFLSFDSDMAVGKCPQMPIRRQGTMHVSLWT
jgi:hypothetical protein